MSSEDLEMYHIVGKMLREIREERGFTLEEAANHLCVTPKSLQRYERGERKIKMGYIKALCNFYNINLDSFMQEARASFVGDIDEVFQKDNPVSYYQPNLTAEYNFFLSDWEKVIIDKYRLADDSVKTLILYLLGLKDFKPVNEPPFKTCPDLDGIEVQIPQTSTELEQKYPPVDSSVKKTG